MEAADGSPPVFQLMSVLRQTVENLRMYDDTQVDNDNVQEPRLRLRAMLPLPRWRKRCLGQPEQQKQQNKSASHLQVRYPHQICYLQQRKKRLLGSQERFLEWNSAETRVSSRFFKFFSPSISGTIN
jgi:hypothetical protein